MVARSVVIGYRFTVAVAGFMIVTVQLKQRNGGKYELREMVEAGCHLL